jgi:hypothetical protein
VLNYLLGYRNLAAFIQKNGERVSQYLLFDCNWDITKGKQNEKENELRSRKKKERFRKREEEKGSFGSPALIREEETAGKERWQAKPITEEESAISPTIKPALSPTFSPTFKPPSPSKQ